MTESHGWLRPLGDLMPPEIRTAIPAVFPGDGYAEAHHLLDPVAEHLGSSRREVPGGYRGQKINELYVGRVKAALVRLAAEGTLVRVGAKDRPPNGTSPGSVSYWTPGAYEKAKADLAEREAEAVRVELRWTLVANRLDAAGAHLRPNGSLTLVDWENLLGSAGL